MCVCVCVYQHIYVYTHICVYIYISGLTRILSCSDLGATHRFRALPFAPAAEVARARHGLNTDCVCCCLQDDDDDDKFIPTKHRTPPFHYSSRPAAAHTDTETPRQ